MKNKYFLITSALFSLLLPSCNNSNTGKIYFDLEGGSFLDDSFSTNYLVGKAGSPITEEIPNPHKDGYYFIGWREKDKNGAYRIINKRLDDDGNSYYCYPYGTDTFYAYFEPLATIEFDLTEGKESGKLIAPKRDAQNFSGNTLNGYSSKKISSTDYLPTCDGKSLHLNFDYWYSEYPFTISKDENDTEHYIIDKSKEKGIYRFDQAFSKGTMEFILESSITLYAKWTQDPKITIHTNIDKVDGYEFQADTTIKTELTGFMKDKFDIDFSMEASAYYTIIDEKKYRFKGFFLDQKFTQPFSLDSQIYTKDFSLYMKWDKQISITFDFNGGEISGKKNMILSDYFSSDTLPISLLEEMTPTKENNDFVNYTLNGHAFIFNKDTLPNEDITLIAEYKQYPLLTLSYDYPTGYEKEKKSDIKYFIEESKDISTCLTDFKNEIKEEGLICDSFYTLNSDNKKTKLDFSIMPKMDTTIYLSLNYLTKVTIKTIVKDSIDESLETSFYAQNDIVTENNLSLTEIIKDSDTYLFDGLYLSDNLDEKVTLPYHCKSSHDSLPTLTFYKKMTKAITLRFENEKKEEQFSLKIIPGSKLSLYEDEITKKIGRKNYKLKIGSEYIRDFLPEEDCTITIVLQN